MKLNRKKAVIFDLDGTLVDSMWMWKAIDIEYLARFGLACPDDLQKEIEGMSFSETAVYFKERFRLKESLDEIKNAWIQMSIEITASSLKNCGIPLPLATTLTACFNNSSPVFR